MSLIAIIITLVVVGLLLWLISLIPMDATIRKIIHIVAIIAVVLWLLIQFGVLDSAYNVKIGK